MKHGVRISPLGGENTILVMQTQNTGRNGEYVLSHHEDRKIRQCHVRKDRDGEIARAVRAALRGELDQGARK